MPVGRYGQKITFAVQLDADQKYTSFVYVRAKKGDTIRKIAARKGHPELVQTILSLNTTVKLANGHFLRSATQVLKEGSLIRLPGTLAQGDSLDVYCGNNRPVIKDGYAVYDTVDRIGRVGLNRFKGYNPIAIDIDVQFEDYAHQDDWKQPNGGAPVGQGIENDITTLERMAGRGNYAGAADGPPAVLRVSVTGANGAVVPLIPLNYQWSKQNPSAPLYRIATIAWAQGALSDDQGRRVRQAATITIKQYTPLVVVKNSASQRAKAKSNPSIVPSS